MLVKNEYSIIASGSGSHAEGCDKTSSKTSAHSEGTFSRASGESSHSVGDTTIDSGSGSHAEGYSTIAPLAYSHSKGSYTIKSVRILILKDMIHSRIWKTKCSMYFQNKINKINREKGLKRNKFLLIFFSIYYIKTLNGRYLSILQ